MFEVSPRFLDALHGPHKVVTSCDVLLDGVEQATDLPIAGGTINVDESSQVRRSGSITFADPNLDPAEVSDLLAPYGTELLIKRGVQFVEGDVEMVPLGVFRIESGGRSNWLGGVSCTLADRSRVVARARFLKPYTTQRGKLVWQEIADLISDVVPTWTTYDETESREDTTRSIWERDRWEAIEKLGRSIGADVFFDPNGDAVVRSTVLEPAEFATWKIATGEILADVETGRNAENVYNAVVASGDSSGETPPVTWASYLKTGPVRWGGPFGKVPRFYSSPQITTAKGAQKAAWSIIARSSGLYRQVDPTTIVNPALDVGDTVEVVLPDGTSWFQIVRAFSIPLEPENAEMTIATRVAEDEIELSEGASLD